MTTKADSQFELTPPPPAIKPNSHVVIAVRHMNKRRDALLAKRETIDKEIGELDTALLALKV